MKNKKTKLILICILSAVLLPILFVWGHDIWRHHVLVNDFNRAVDSMQGAIGQDFIDDSGCGYYPEKSVIVGKGEKLCTLNAATKKQVEDIAAAQDLLDRLSQNIIGFSGTNYRPVQNPNNPDYASGGVGLVHDRTKTSCAIKLTFNNESSDYKNAEIEVVCNDTSWFTRNFQRNNSIFTLW